uniref:Glycosyltransferase family 92 protein n=1 Tax=Plectus sambesii TaxID=2011161 RepID=A0A914WM31_9BILA
MDDRRRVVTVAVVPPDAVVGQAQKWNRTTESGQPGLRWMDADSHSHLANIVCHEMTQRSAPSTVGGKWPEQTVKCTSVLALLTLFGIMSVLVGYVDLRPATYTGDYHWKRFEQLPFSGILEARGNMSPFMPVPTYIKHANAEPLRPLYAYYDPRFQRISVLILSSEVLNATAYCRYFDDAYAEFKAAHRTVVYPDYVVNCPPAENIKYIFVTGTAHASVEKKQMISITIDPHSTRWPFASAPIYGDYHHWFLLLQFVEFHRANGASNFIIYHINSDNATRALLDHYGRRGVAQVIDLPDPRSNLCAGAHRCRHNFQIQDCLMRSVNRFRYAAVIDIDELMALTDPTKTMLDWLRSMDRPYFGSFQFRCRWAMRKSVDPAPHYLFDSAIDELDQLVEKKLPAIRFTKLSSPAPQRHTSKCIIKPEAVEYMGVHYVRQYSGGKEAYRTYFVEAEDAYTRHYRNLSTWGVINFREVSSFGQFSIVELPSKVLEETVSRSKCTLHAIRNITTPSCAQYY